MLVSFKVAPDASLADELHALAEANLTNLTDDVMWGVPGTLLAMQALHAWTSEARWEEAARESASVLRERRGDDGLWRQDEDYRGLGTLHGAAGNTLALLRVEPDDQLAGETAAVPPRYAARRDR